MNALRSSVCITALVLGNSALADELPPSLIDWSGSYAGIFGSIGTMTNTGATDYGGVGGIDNVGALGLSFGNLMQDNNVVYGYEATLQGPGQEGGGQFFGEYDYRHEAAWDWVLSLRGRAGIASGNSLFYTTAGVTIADVEYFTCYINGRPNCLAFATNGEQAYYEGLVFGMNAGIGIEHALNENWSLKAEYNINVLASKYADRTVLGNNGENTDANSFTHSLHLGLNYHFGGLDAHATSPSATSANWAGQYLTFGAMAGLVETTHLHSYGGPYTYDASGAPFIGYQRYSQKGNIVKGFSVDLIGPGMAGETVWDSSPTSTGGNYIATSDWNWAGTLQGRIGIASGDALIFASAGLAVLDADLVTCDSATCDGNDLYYSDTQLGAVAGFGLQYRLNEKSSFTMEYQYFAFPSQYVTSPNGNDNSDLRTGGHFLKFGYTQQIGQGVKQDSEPTHDWSGTYAGLSLEAATTGAMTHGYYGSLHGSDLNPAINAQIGHNWQNGALVYGVEARFGTGRFGEANTYDSDYYIATADWNWHANLQGRVGFATGDLLMYATAGVTIANVDFLYCYDEPCDPTDDYNSEVAGSARIGFVGGVGVEYAINDTSSVFAEFSYTALDKVYATTAIGGIPSEQEGHHSTYSSNITFGWNRKF